MKRVHAIGVRRSGRRSEAGYGTGEIIVGALVLACLSWGFLTVWDWIGGVTKHREKMAKERAHGRSVEAQEAVVVREIDGSFKMTFRTG
jgi:hypothetical protein